MLAARHKLVKVDYDAGVRPLPRREIAFRLMRAGFTLKRLVKRRSPSGTGWHLVASVRPRPRNATEVVVLQLLLGSDPRREACNFRRARILRRMPSWAREQFNVLYGKIEGRHK